MSLLTAASALIAFGMPAPKVEITVDIKDGEAITGERSIRVTASATNSYITQVEFYVGNDLRDSDTSTPYEFKIDSLAEPDGTLQLKFRAYSESGQNAEKVVNVKIDNQLGRGVAYHLEQGQAALTDRKFREAIVSGRIALRIDEKNVPARILLARANFGLNVFDSAQKFAEDALAIEPNNVQALDLVAATNLRRSLNLVAREGGNRSEFIANSKIAMKTAVEARRKALDLAVDNFGPVTEANLKAYSDAAIRASRFSLAISQLGPAFDKDNRDASIANRLAYAQMRSGRVNDALKTMALHKRYGKPDAYGYALLAVLESEASGATASDEAMKEALLSDPNNLGVQTAQAYLALRNNRVATLRQLANSAARDAGGIPEVLYYRSAVSNRLGDYGAARRFFGQAVLAEPAFEAAYIEAGNESLAILQSGRQVAADQTRYFYESAQAMYEAALAARPESVDALCGLALVAMFQNKPQDAINFAEAAVRANPEDGAAYYAASGAYSKMASALTRTGGGQFNPDVTKFGRLAQEAITKANQLDPRNLGGRVIPRESDLWQYLTEAGRPVVMTPPR